MASRKAFRVACATVLLMAAIVLGAYGGFGHGDTSPTPAPSPLSPLMEQYCSASFTSGFITPESPLVQEFADNHDSLQALYEAAVSWVWVSDDVLYHEEDRWATPEEFFSTASLATNPAPGACAGDCEDQACALVSAMRAFGLSPEMVRVGVGKVVVRSPETDNAIIALHCWAEYQKDGAWVVLDPSQATLWDEQTSALIYLTPTPFEHYETERYQIVELWAYFNDAYHFCALTDSGTAPESWAP